VSAPDLQLFCAREPMQFEVDGVPVFLGSGTIIADDPWQPAHPYRKGREASWRVCRLIAEGQPDLPPTEVPVVVAGYPPADQMTDGAQPAGGGWAWATVRVAADDPRLADPHAPEDERVPETLNARGPSPFASGLDAGKVAAPLRRALAAMRSDADTAAGIDAEIVAAKRARAQAARADLAPPDLNHDADGNPV
jgi:hypothetical protein